MSPQKMGLPITSTNKCKLDNPVNSAGKWSIYQCVKTVHPKLVTEQLLHNNTQITPMSNNVNSSKQKAKCTYFSDIIQL